MSSKKKPNWIALYHSPIIKISVDLISAVTLVEHRFISPTPKHPPHGTGVLVFQIVQGVKFSTQRVKAFARKIFIREHRSFDVHRYSSKIKNGAKRPGKLLSH